MIHGWRSEPSSVAGAVRSQVAFLNGRSVPARVSSKEAGLSQALCTIPPRPAVPPVGQMHGRLMHLVQNPLESSLIAGKKYSKAGTWGRKPGWRQALFWLKSPIVWRKGIERGRREEILDRSEGPSVPFPGRGTTQPQWTIWPPEGLPLCKQLPWHADALYSRSVWLKYQRVTREHAVWPITPDLWNQCSSWCQYLKAESFFFFSFLSFIMSYKTLFQKLCLCFFSSFTFRT